MRAYILSAIIKRDLKETFRNPQTLVIVGLTIFINIFFSLVISKPLWVMTFAMSIVMVGFTLTSFIVTEEKDKKTLEALLISPASYNEILVGKLFFTVFLTIAISLGLIFSLHLNEVSVLHTLVSVPMGALVICMFGLVVGLICPSQAALSGFGTILMMGLFLPELLAPTNDIVGYIARALPTHHVIQISSLTKDGVSSIVFKHYGMLLLSLLVTVLWVLSFVKTSSVQESRSWKYNRANKGLSLLLLGVLILSSIVFVPLRGKIIKENGVEKYVNSQYGLSIPYDSKKFDLKEYSIQNKYVAKFILKSFEDDYLFLTMKRNLEKKTREEELKKVLSDLKKEDVLNLRVDSVILPNGLSANRIQFESKEAHEVFYLFLTEKHLYKFGINSDGKSPNLNELRTILDTSFKSLSLF